MKGPVEITGNAYEINAAARLLWRVAGVFGKIDSISIDSRRVVVNLSKYRDLDRVPGRLKMTAVEDNPLLHRLSKSYAGVSYSALCEDEEG